MSELQFSVDGVFDALAAQPVKSNGGGRAVMLIAARKHEGATSVACAVAKAAGPMPCYALDLDLRRNGLAKALADGKALGPRIDGKFNGVSFYGVQDARGQAALEVRAFFNFHRVGAGRLYAGVFEANKLPQGARVAISGAADYWDAARATAATVVVDAPSLDRSQVGLRVARHMDGVVLVVGADAGAAPAAIAAKAALKHAGANVMGLVYTGASAPVMAIERLLRQAG